MQATSTITVRRGTPVDVGPLVHVLAEALLEGPVGEWLIPSTIERRVVYFRYFRLVLNHALRYGWVDTTDDLSAVAIWYRRNEEAPTATPGYQNELQKAAGRYAPRFRLLGSILAAHHPRIPHDYLAFMAVHPQRQSRGIGSALLTTAHRRIDSQGRPAYLEASNERNRDLYERLGYRRRAPLMLPTAGPPIWRMWRGQPNDGVPAPFPRDELARRRTL